MPPEHKIDEGTMAIIELTAQRVVKGAMKEFRLEYEQAIELHTAKCEARKLGAFKASVVGAVGAFVMLAIQWAKEAMFK